MYFMLRSVVICLLVINTVLYLWAINYCIWDNETCLQDFLIILERFRIYRRHWNSIEIETCWAIQVLATTIILFYRNSEAIAFEFLIYFPVIGSRQYILYLLKWHSIDYAFLHHAPKKIVTFRLCSNYHGSNSNSNREWMNKYHIFL